MNHSIYIRGPLDPSQDRGRGARRCIAVAGFAISARTGSDETYAQSTSRPSRPVRR